MFGAPKSNKTLLAVQMAIAVASGNPLFDYYRVLTPGPVLLVEQDDPAGAASFKDILQRSPVPVAPRRLLKSKISRCALPPLKEPLKRVRNDESAKASPEA
jgi:RecA-family ATPase